MANRTFLLSTDLPTKPADGARVDILCAASYMIPLFWYMLFDQSSIISASAATEDGKEVEYPYLSRSGNEAISAALARWPAVRAVVGPEHEPLFYTWHSFVEPRSKGFLQCETVELWMMFDDTASFVRHVELCLQALTQPIGSGLSPAWRELLGQANVLNGEAVSPPGSYSFCGYDWVHPVPWE
jgi:hypothetical protein